MDTVGTVECESAGALVEEVLSGDLTESEVVNGDSGDSGDFGKVKEINRLYLIIL